jgi:hypothetical protein
MKIRGVDISVRRAYGPSPIQTSTMLTISWTALYLCPLLSHLFPFPKQHLAFNMTLANFTKLSQELRDQIWAEAAAIQGQQVRRNFFKCNSLPLLPLN